VEGGRVEVGGGWRVEGSGGSHTPEHRGVIVLVYVGLAYFGN
jgi:hypothetical protein